MSIYTVIILTSARKSMQKIPLIWQNRIFKTLTLLQTEPYLGQKMRGDFAGYYRVKVWPYRIIYSIRQQRLVIKVVEIDQRGSISYG